MRLDWRGMVQSLIVALLLAILGAALSTYNEVKLLRHDVDRLQVYVDQLWEDSRHPSKP